MIGEPSFQLSHHWSKLQKHLSIKCAMYRMFTTCPEHMIQKDINHRDLSLFVGEFGDNSGDI